MFANFYPVFLYFCNECRVLEKKFESKGFWKKIENQRGFGIYCRFWIESQSGICWFWLRRGVLLDNKITLPIQAEPGERICVCVTNIGPAGSGYHRLTVSVYSTLILALVSNTWSRLMLCPGTVELVMIRVPCTFTWRSQMKILLHLCHKLEINDKGA